MKICGVWFDHMDWIEYDGEAEILIAISDHIFSPNLYSSPIPPKFPPQILNSTRLTSICQLITGNKHDHYVKKISSACVYTSEIKAKVGYSGLII